MVSGEEKFDVMFQCLSKNDTEVKKGLKNLIKDTKNNIDIEVLENNAEYMTDDKLYIYIFELFGFENVKDDPKENNPEDIGDNENREAIEKLITCFKKNPQRVGFQKETHDYYKILRAIILETVNDISRTPRKRKEKEKEKKGN